MIRINETTKGTIFEPVVKEKYVQAKLSTGKKNQDGSWTNMSWNVRFIGKCYDQASRLKEKDKIELRSGYVENSYDKETKKSYVNVIVFEFETEYNQEVKETKNPFKDAPKEVEIKNDDLPF
jgi:hypothetical protein